MIEHEKNRAGYTQGVVQRHRDRLLALPNVVGVGVGSDPVTGEETVMVYVTRKLSKDQLAHSYNIPRELDGIPVSVAEIGAIVAQDEPWDEAKPVAEYIEGERRPDGQ